MLPNKFCIVDLEYGDEVVAAKSSRFACLLSIGLLEVEGDLITRRYQRLIKPLYEDELTPKIQGITGLTPLHFQDASSVYEPLREVFDIIRNKYVFSWGHSDSVKLRYWAGVMDIPYPHFKAVCAYSYLLATDLETQPRMLNELKRRGFDVVGHHEALKDCEFVLTLLQDREDYENQISEPISFL